MGLTQVRVLRTGTPSKGRMDGERVNLLDDYRKYFNVSDTPKPAGIAVLTDADDTWSRAQGDYATLPRLRAADGDPCVFSSLREQARR